MYGHAFDGPRQGGEAAGWRSANDGRRTHDSDCSRGQGVCSLRDPFPTRFYESKLYAPPWLTRTSGAQRSVRNRPVANNSEKGGRAERRPSLATKPRAARVWETALRDRDDGDNGVIPRGRWGGLYGPGGSRREGGARRARPRRGVGRGRPRAFSKITQRFCSAAKPSSALTMKLVALTVDHSPRGRTGSVFGFKPSVQPTAR